MSIEEMIYLAVQGNGAVTALVSDRVYPSQAAVGAALPFVVFNRISTDPYHTHDGPSSMHRVSVQFSCWSATYAGAHDLAKAVRVALDNVVIDTGIRGMFADDGDLGSASPDIFGRRVDFDFLHPQP